MKKLFLLSSLLSLFALAFSGNAYAKKKRYIKRMHGAKINLNIIPFEKSSNTKSGGLDADLAYSYNWKGMIEVGPYFGIKWIYLPASVLENLDLGVFVEYNFIKNKGKKKMVPAAGLKIGTKKIKGDTAWKLALAPYVSLKYFVAKRTPIITTLGYEGSSAFSSISNFSTWTHSSFLMVGFAYYFDFY